MRSSCRLSRIIKLYCSVWRTIRTTGMRSNWYNTLTDLDVGTLISGVQARVKVEAVERRKRRAENLRRKAEREIKKLVKLLTEAGAALTPENIRA